MWILWVFVAIVVIGSAIRLLCIGMDGNEGRITATQADEQIEGLVLFLLVAAVVVIALCVRYG
jgi:hypothetical protein